MTNLDNFISSNHHLLKQLSQQLAQLRTVPKNIYFADVPIIGGATIGAHLRHILDFYQALNAGITTGIVDYDDRKRDIKIEHCLEAALSQLDTIMEQLDNYCFDLKQPVKIRAAVDIHSNSDLLSSNLARELQTLHSHTTHHMAIIAIALKLNGCEVDSDFGKAPSSIEYEQKVLSATENVATITAPLS